MRGLNDVDTGVAELQALAGDRPDLLAEHAGVCLGWASVGQSIQAACFRAEAELCRASGAPSDLIEKWIAVGRERAGASQQAPYGRQ
jgi:hypothetical protein